MTAPLPPLVPAPPVVGAFPAFLRDRGAVFRAAAAHAPVSRIPLGPVRPILVYKPADVAAVLAAPLGRYTKDTPPYAQVAKVLGDGLFTADGPGWRRKRRMVQPQFRRARVGDLATMMARAARDAVDTWELGTTVDARVAMFRFALRVVVDALLGDAREIDMEAFDRELAVVLRVTDRRVNDPFTPPSWLPTPENRRFDRALAHLDTVVHDLIATRRHGPGRDDLLQRLMDAEDEERGPLTDEELRDEVMTMLLAGHETTAATLSWALHALAHDPALQEAARAEVDAVVGEDTPSLQHAMQLDLVARILKETLRRYPPLWGFTRTAEEDDVVGGCRIPKGSLLFVVPWCAHHDPEHWHDPETFDPDRFLPERSADRPTHAFFPFGVGGRKCLGERFAMLEMTILLATVLQDVRLIPTGPPVPAEFSLTLRPAVAMSLRMEPRAGGGRDDDGDVDELPGGGGLRRPHGDP